MVRRECVWDVCVCISYTGDEGQQLGSSFLWNGRGSEAVCRISDSESLCEIRVSES